MDTESIEVLNRLVMRWKQRTEQCESTFASQTITSDDEQKLDSMIQSLGSHIEGLQNIFTTIQELNQFHLRLINLRSLLLTNKPTQPLESTTEVPNNKCNNNDGDTKMNDTFVAAEIKTNTIEKNDFMPKNQEMDCGAGDILQNIDTELQVIETEMREMKCHHEEFLIRYIQMKDDYRTPIQALPLPYGFSCHKRYVYEVDLLKTRIRNSMKQTEVCQEKLKVYSTKDLNDVDRLEIQKINRDLNQSITISQNLQADLFYFLTHIQPIDAEAFHMKCKELIERRLLCLESKRMHQIRLLLLSKK